MAYLAGLASFCLTFFLFGLMMLLELLILHVSPPKFGAYVVGLVPIGTTPHYVARES